MQKRNPSSTSELSGMRAYWQQKKNRMGIADAAHNKMQTEKSLWFYWLRVNALHRLPVAITAEVWRTTNSIVNHHQPSSCMICPVRTTANPCDYYVHAISHIQNQLRGKSPAILLAETMRIARIQIIPISVSHLVTSRRGASKLINQSFHIGQRSTVAEHTIIKLSFDSFEINLFVLMLIITL